MNLGIIGSRHSGKTSLFNALTSLNVDISGYQKSGVNIGVVKVPDERMERLIKMYQPKKISHTSIEFIDIAGSPDLNEIGTQKLGQLREVDALVQVVCFFKNPASGALEINPAEEIESIGLELVLADLDSIQRKIERLEKQARSGDVKIREQIKTLEGLKEALDNNLPLRNKKLTPQEEAIINELQLLTPKQILFVANIAEQDIPGEVFVKKIREIAGEKAKIIAVCAKIEAELGQLEEEERKEYMKELGIESSGLNKLINTCYNLLDLVTFFTCGPKEVKAYPIPRHTKAPHAASKVHSDIERGFIRAEVMNYKDLIALGDEAAVKEKGLFRIEGKEYEVQDGDMFCFRFNV
ncbi:redox-regulated ATPase YchF [bacterium]|nr:redox-regulated ATPase YchF [bacterium]MBU1154138.1 redox-regulated ATPase YchF [bacterium]MBU1782208.1 redox-regulated ATPase YchF [bacterium]